MQAYHKAQKAKTLKKAKLEKAKQRQEKLARRNPDRITRQIEELKALEESGEIKPHDRKVLVELEKEFVAVKKAREALGVKDEERKPRGGEGGRGGPRGGGRGGSGANAIRVDRRRGNVEGGDESDSGESTASSVRDIPMPSGTPPPIPRQPTREHRTPHALPPKPAPPPAITTYTAAPIVRDLRKEAAAFIPATVQRKMLDTAASRPNVESTSAPSASGDDGEVKPTLPSFTASMVVNAAPEVDTTKSVELEVDEEYERFKREMDVDITRDDGN